MWLIFIFRFTEKFCFKHRVRMNNLNIFVETKSYYYFFVLFQCSVHYYSGIFYIYIQAVPSETLYFLFDFNAYYKKKKENK